MRSTKNSLRDLRGVQGVWQGAAASERLAGRGSAPTSSLA
jgi:hypothetical protein